MEVISKTLQVPLALVAAVDVCRSTDNTHDSILQLGLSLRGL